ncbi:MAG TPA: putative toxin-antitoxin system toxin component, PIN family [Herpetosiphonaceae bacterium]|nr:putative toxin-antitoxin system toxin component, PIN family [Herpetosiphonaceae bacterium]
MPSVMPVSAVVDTNIVVSAFLSRRGAPHALLQALYAGAFRLVLSPQLREEYERVLARPGLARRFALAPAELAAFFRFLDRRAQPVTPREPSPVAVRDVQDAHVLAAALEGGAGYLITGDDDLLVLAGDPRLGTLQIVTIRTFLDALEEDEAPSP